MNTYCNILITEIQCFCPTLNSQLKCCTYFYKNYHVNNAGNLNHSIMGGSLERV